MIKVATEESEVSAFFEETRGFNLTVCLLQKAGFDIQECFKTLWQGSEGTAGENFSSAACLEPRLSSITSFTKLGGPLCPNNQRAQHFSSFSYSPSSWLDAMGDLAPVGQITPQMQDERVAPSIPSDLCATLAQPFPLSSYSQLNPYHVLGSRVSTTSYRPVVSSPLRNVFSPVSHMTTHQASYSSGTSQPYSQGLTLGAHAPLTSHPCLDISSATAQHQPKSQVGSPLLHQDSKSSDSSQTVRKGPLVLTPALSQSAADFRDRMPQPRKLPFLEPRKRPEGTKAPVECSNVGGDAKADISKPSAMLTLNKHHVDEIDSSSPPVRKPRKLSKTVARKPPAKYSAALICSGVKKNRQTNAPVAQRIYRLRSMTNQSSKQPALQENQLDKNGSEAPLRAVSPRRSKRDMPMGRDETCSRRKRRGIEPVCDSEQGKHIANDNLTGASSPKNKAGQALDAEKKGQAPQDFEPLQASRGTLSPLGAQQIQVTTEDICMVSPHLNSEVKVKGSGTARKPIQTKASKAAQENSTRSIKKSTQRRKRDTATESTRKAKHSSNRGHSSNAETSASRRGSRRKSQHRSASRFQARKEAEDEPGSFVDGLLEPRIAPTLPSLTTAAPRQARTVLEPRDLVLLADDCLLRQLAQDTDVLMDQYEADVARGCDDGACATFYMDRIETVRRDFWHGKLLERKSHARGSMLV